MKRLYVSILLVLSLSSLVSCAHRNRDLYDPQPIALHQPNQDVRQAIRLALADYGWLIDKESPGQIVARQSRGGHEARVKIGYSKNNVDIDYLDSQNLNFEQHETGNTIHGRYNTWVTNLERRIAVLVQ